MGFRYFTSNTCLSLIWWQIPYAFALIVFHRWCDPIWPGLLSVPVPLYDTFSYPKNLSLNKATRIIRYIMSQVLPPQTPQPMQKPFIPSPFQLSPSWHRIVWPRSIYDECTHCSRPTSKRKQKAHPNQNQSLAKPKPATPEAGGGIKPKNPIDTDNANARKFYTSSSTPIFREQ
jgi:hypothetical protein